MEKETEVIFYEQIQPNKAMCARCIIHLEIPHRVGRSSSQKDENYHPNIHNGVLPTTLSLGTTQPSQFQTYWACTHHASSSPKDAFPVTVSTHWPAHNRGHVPLSLT